jgi:hypothetical protein
MRASSVLKRQSTLAPSPIALPAPSLRLSAQRLDVRQAAPQALPYQNRELDLDPMFSHEPCTGV